MLVDRSGREVAHTVRPTPFSTVPDGVEAPVAGLLSAVAGAVGELGPAVGEVAAVGVAGLAESGTPLDTAGGCLAPVIAWHDPRGAETVAFLWDRFGEELELAIGQRLRTVSSVAKLGWLADHGLQGVRCWLGVPEMVVRRLTGVVATDYSLAARTGAYDVRHRRPMTEVTAALGLSDDIFPAPAPAGTVMGSVTPSGAAWAGVPAGIPVTVAGHDHLAGAAGAGAADDDVANSVGTAETLVGWSSTLPDVAAAVDRRLAVGLTPEGDGWAVLAGAARAGLVLDAAAGALGQSPAALDRMTGGAGSVDATGWVREAATAVKEGALPGPLPEGTPGAVWNAVLHALCVLTWEAVTRVESVAGAGRRLVVFGGGSRSRPWLLAKEATGHLPVVRSGATEAVARGAALYAGVAAGWWPTVQAAPAPPALE